MRENSADSRRSGTAFPPAGAFSFPRLLRAEKRPSPSRPQKGRGKPPSLKNAQQKHPLPGRPYRPEKGFPQRRGIQTFCGGVETGSSPGTARGQKAYSSHAPEPEYPSAPYVPALRRQKSLSRNGKRKKSPPARFFLLTAQAESPINPFTPRGSNSVVECNLAKVEVAGSNPVSRSSTNFVAT